MGIQQRRRREREQRRQQILNAARNLLFKKGLNAISVNQIARQAELAVGTIYFYFRSKEEIFAVLQEEGLELLLKDVRRALETGADARESLHNIAQAYLNFSREQKSYFDVINYFLSCRRCHFYSRNQAADRSAGQSNPIGCRASPKGRGRAGAVSCHEHPSPRTSLLGDSARTDPLSEDDGHASGG